MGQNQSKPKRGSNDSNSSTIPFASAPIAPKDNDELLEKNYAAYYSSDTYNDISAAAATSFPLAQPTIKKAPATIPRSKFNPYQPTPTLEVTPPAPRPHLRRVSELIDPQDLVSQSSTAHVLEAYDPKLADRNPYTSSSNHHEHRSLASRVDRNKELPVLVESPSGNVFGVQEFAAHPNRPLAIRERQEGIKAALARAEAEDEWSRTGSAEPAKGVRKGSGDSTGSGRTVDSGVSFGSRGSGASGKREQGRKDSKDSKVSKSSLGEWERAKIEEGRRSYEDKLARKEMNVSGEGGRKKKGFLCFR